MSEGEAPALDPAVAFAGLMRHGVEFVLGARLKIRQRSIVTLEVALDARTVANMEIGAWRTLAGDMMCCSAFSAWPVRARALRAAGQ